MRLSPRPHSSFLVSGYLLWGRLWNFDARYFNICFKNESLIIKGNLTNPIQKIFNMPTNGTIRSETGWVCTIWQHYKSLYWKGLLHFLGIGSTAYFIMGIYVMNMLQYICKKDIWYWFQEKLDEWEMEIYIPLNKHLRKLQKQRVSMKSAEWKGHERKTRGAVHLYEKPNRTGFSTENFQINGIT